MAEVFSGYVIGSHGFQKPVAVKRLLPELANDHVFVDRLIGEAKLLVGMQHGNIVSVLDLARDGNDVFLVMEFVDGPSLRQLLKARGQRRLSIAVSTYIVQSAAAGLEFAHARPGSTRSACVPWPSNRAIATQKCNTLSTRSSTSVSRTVGEKAPTIWHRRFVRSHRACRTQAVLALR
jgi:serine/threonine protein kinase